MALSAGARFGPYEVLLKLGEGGMGEVYRARDIRLKRDVAIKVLPEGVTTAIANLYWQRSDGSGDAQRLTESTATQIAGSSHPNGKLLAFAEQNSKTGWDILLLPVDGDEASGWKAGKPTVFLNGPFNEQEPMFSPDGRWLAYYSDESGQARIYIRPYPGPGGVQQISNEGGFFGAWSRTKPELFYRSPNTGLIMVASYTTAGGSFQAGKPRAWSPVRTMPRPRLRPYALHPDGERIAAASAEQVPSANNRRDQVVLVFNFFDELRRPAPASK
jgi:Tol biopolymer transport system component